MLNCSSGPRARRRAGRRGRGAGDRVAVLAPNTHLMLEAHYGVPLAGAVLVALNTRLTAPSSRYIVEHSGARVLIYDSEFEPSPPRRARLGHAVPPVRGRHARCSDEYEQMLAARAERVRHAGQPTSARCCRSTTPAARPARPRA